MNRWREPGTPCPLAAPPRDPADAERVCRACRRSYATPDGVGVRVEIPAGGDEHDQDEEYVRLRRGPVVHKVRIHDYGEIFGTRGLYERILCLELGYGSPQKVCALLKEAVEAEGGSPRALRVLDLGAGNGLAGDCLRRGLGCETLVGVDILPQARDAALRDRPGLYDAYHALDLSRPADAESALLRSWRFTALVTVGALAFGDIPARAFAAALDLLEDGAWVAFNLREDFVSSGDRSGFRDMLEALTGSRLRLLRRQAHLHRRTVSGKPLTYVAIVGRKTNL